MSGADLLIKYIADGHNAVIARIVGVTSADDLEGLAPINTAVEEVAVWWRGGAM